MEAPLAILARYLPLGGLSSSLKVRLLQLGGLSSSLKAGRLVCREMLTVMGGGGSLVLESWSTRTTQCFGPKLASQTGVQEPAIPVEPARHVSATF